MTTEKSFAEGSPAPGPLPKGGIRLYSMRFCPFAHRARLVLNTKGIKYETININLTKKPEWFFKKNPSGLVPTVETSDGDVVYDSAIVCEYLDEVYPDKKLIPSSPFEKAQQKMMLEYFSSKIQPYFFKIPTMRRNQEDVSETEKDFKEKLAKLNEALVNKKFFGGETVTMIDYMMWPFFERLEIYDLKHCLSETPELKKWIESMLEDPGVKASIHSVSTHKGFYKTYIEKNPNYDYGL